MTYLSEKQESAIRVIESIGNMTIQNIPYSNETILVNKICKDKRYDLLTSILGQDNENIYLKVVCKENPVGVKKIINGGAISWQTFNEHFEIIENNSFTKTILREKCTECGAIGLIKEDGCCRDCGDKQTK